MSGLTMEHVRRRRTPLRRHVQGIVFALVGGAVLISMAGGAPPHVAAQTTPVVVPVELEEWSVSVDAASVPAGVPVRFVATNRGGITHSLQVAGLNAQTALLAPGETGTLDLVFGAPGSITLVCPVGGGSHRQRGMETSLTVDAPVAGSAVAATPAPPPVPTAAALTAPGADVDRVGLPDAYQTRFAPFYVFDRADNRQVRAVFVNPIGAQVREGQPYPYGTILVMETYRAVLGPDNQVALDENGRYIRGALAGIFVMRKERGYGEKYGPDRTGEWEYVAYRPDGSGFSAPPERSQACAQCHLAVSDAQRDWVVRANLFFANPRPAIGGILQLPRTGHGTIAVIPSLLPAALAVALPLLAAGVTLLSRRR